MCAAFTLCEEKACENEAMLDATFGDPSAFLVEIVAQGAKGGGSTKFLALASAVKKRREQEKALAAMLPLLVNVHWPPCVTLDLCSADLGQDRPEVSPTWTDGCGESRAGGTFLGRLLRQS